MDPEDWPPQMQWEEPLWQLYERFSGQWRAGMGGRYGYDYSPAIELIRARGWDLDLCTDLLHSIELEILRQDRVEREQ